MRLNQQSDYALRMLMQVAAAEGERVTIAAVADRYDLSRNHLMKVANVLVRTGFVRGARGRAGGLTLARAPSAIGVGAVVRATEADFALVECFQEGGRCLITPACRLKGVLAEATEAFLSVLDRYTLADLTDENPALAALLRPAA